MLETLINLIFASFALLGMKDPEPAIPPKVIPESSIGGTEVPKGLNCMEDEVIGFNGIPDTLVCIHIDDPISLRG